MRTARATTLAAFAAWACLLLTACREPLPADYVEYAGHWRGEGVLLVIRADGHAIYEQVAKGRRTRIEGPVHDFDANGFRIGLGPLSARFDVQSPPALQGGRWRMTVDGHHLVRVEILPVQADQPGIRI